MFYPIVGSLTQAFGIMVDKVLLTKKKLIISKFVPWLFLFLALFTFFILIFDNRIVISVINWTTVAYFVLMIGLAFVWNILYYRAIKNESVQEFEPILMFSPLLVILLTAIIFPRESDRMIFFIALIASVVLIFSHFERGQLKFQKESLGLIICVFLMSVEVLVIRELLFYFTPASLYFIRCSVLLVVFLIYYRKTFFSIPDRGLPGIILTSLLGAAQMVSRFYGYQNIGIVFTTLVMAMAPVLVYLFCFTCLKEPLKPKKIIGGSVILVCVVAAYLLS